MLSKVEQGTINGIYKDSIHKFLGIPYAAPPIKERRWTQPMPPQKWEGIYQATNFGPICPQKGGASFNLRQDKQSEDCLYLNVWTSTTICDAQQPVMVWIHGGGNLGGAESEDAFDGTNLAKQGVTVVTFNYRLGAFGFIAHPDIGCNFAVLDQVAALEWISNNIGSFGGDPNNITIFGESAGAQAVRNLLSVSRAKGLFHRAIIQSAGFEPYVFASTHSYEKVQTSTEKLFEKLGTSDLEKLQKLPANDILEASMAFSGTVPPPGEVHTPANLIWNQVPDGEIIAKDGFPGCDVDLPILIGCVENEARYFIKPNGTYHNNDLSRMAQVLATTKSDQALQLLNNKDLTTYEALDLLFTTTIWFEPSYATVNKFVELGYDVYYYHFARVSPEHYRTKELAQHTSEIKYVFGNLQPEEHYDDRDRIISKQLQHAWITFGKKGVPQNEDGTSWACYNRDEPYINHIKDTVYSEPLKLNPLTEIIHSLRK